MGILKRLRASGEALIAQRLSGQSRSFSAEVPGSSGGPLWQMRVDVQSEPQAGGEQLRLRAQLRLSLRRSPVAPSASQLPVHALPARLGRWIERRLESPLLQSLAAPLLDRDISTWIELRASDAALDEGSRALVPERLHALGIELRAGQPVQTWAGQLGGSKPGYATLTLLQLDKSQLPPVLQKQLGPKPFQLAAAVASVVEEA
ncbi:MAG: hypothetical protein HYZ32_03865 [Hydrocarboniphaga effusa]|nr:hypothetical protein [Hydrocarboniphaga effusa]